MRDREMAEKMQFIFGSMFLTAQKWQVMGDRYLAKDNVTTKQWLLLAVIVNLFDSPPTLTQAAEAMGTSRQNIKQIALKLEKRGFLQIKIDENDNRILRLEVTNKSHKFWQERADQDIKFILGLFEFLSDDEIGSLYKVMKKIDYKLNRNP